MENFDYWSILVDSGSIVQCKGTREKTFSYQHHLSILFKDRTAPNVGHISNFVKRMRIALFQSCVSRWEQKKRKQILLVEQEKIKLFSREFPDREFWLGSEDRTATLLSKVIVARPNNISSKSESGRRLFGVLFSVDRCLSKRCFSEQRHFKRRLFWWRRDTSSHQTATTSDAWGSTLSINNFDNFNWFYTREWSWNVGLFNVCIKLRHRSI